ncbi:AMP-binding protein [Klebsiella sp. I138]|uniref:AMP-binding protein n=1 Tax=Klebsiella sp. I138 TaxID=2755385 RepID=UPI003DA8A017
MMTPLALSRWLNAPRPADTLIAWVNEQRWTLGQLRNDVARWVTQLEKQSSQRWALCFDDSYLFLVALLATLHAGKTPVMPGHGRISLLDEQRALFDGVISDKAMGWNGPTLIVGSAQQALTEAITFRNIADDACIELFTSGSTGQPKRVIKPLASLDREAELLATHFADRLAGCRVVASVAPQHLYGLTFRIFLPMALGLPLHAGMLNYAEQVTALDHRHRYAFISSPAFLKRLDHRLEPPSVDLIISAGGLLAWQDAVRTADWLKRWPDEIYGSTETGVLAWRLRDREQAAWQPLPGVRFHAQGETFRVFSPLIADNNGLLLDDSLQFAANGHFQLTGRRGRVVKIEEKRISLGEVEQRLLELEGIREAVALPVTRGGRQSVGVLLVLDAQTRQRWHNTSKILEQAWRQALRPTLEPVAIPRYWRIIDEIPVNSMNKRVYAQLQELFHETP